MNQVASKVLTPHRTTPFQPPPDPRAGTGAVLRHRRPDSLRSRCRLPPTASPASVCLVAAALPGKLPGRGRCFRPHGCFPLLPSADRWGRRPDAGRLGRAETPRPDPRRPRRVMYDDPTPDAVVAQPQLDPRASVNGVPDTVKAGLDDVATSQSLLSSC